MEILVCGAWLSLVERCVRDAEIGGSNPLAPTRLHNTRCKSQPSRDINNGFSNAHFIQVKKRAPSAPSITR